MPAAASAVFRALADPTRRALFERLAAGEASVSDLALAFPVSQPAVSQHLAALRQAGLVSRRQAGRFALYRADPVGLAPLVDWVAHYHAFWRTRLARLATVLEETTP